jgi:hypothetical protein
VADAALKPASDDAAPLTLEAYKKLFDTARDDMAEGRKDSELSRDYYDGDQWTREERAIIEARGQVAIVINRILRAVESIMGVVESNKTAPRALMRNPPEDTQQNPQAGAGPSTSAMPVQPGPMPPSAVPPQQPQQGGKKPPDAGDIATETLRYIADTTHFKNTKMDVLETGLVEGCGAVVIEVDQRKDVTVAQVRWEEFFYDPRSRNSNFSDARYLGIAKWMYADDVAALYPKSKTDIDAIMGDGGQGLGLDQTFEDRPNSLTAKQPWLDKKLQRVMVVDMYHLHGGQWYRCVFFAGGVLQSGVSEYKDDDGNPCCPIEAWSCYINRKNERYGVVKPMRDPQKGSNMTNSKSIHEMSTRQVQQTEPSAPPVDVDIVRREAARPDGVLPSGWQVVPRSDLVASNMEMRAYYLGEIERMGAAPSVLARQGADASGRAQQIRVQTGLQELARVLNRHSEWENRCYMQMFWRARQFWDGPKWIRVTHELEAPQYIQVNEPVGIGPDGQPIFKNHIAKMDVDIILDKTPDTATLEQEIFNEFVELAKVYGPQAVPLEVLIEMSSISKKREIINKLEDVRAQQAPQQQVQMQAQLAKFQAELEEIKSTIRKNNTQSDLNEANTVKTAMGAHLEVNRAVQLPPGVTVNNSGTPVPIVPPPPKTMNGNSSAT